MSHLSDYVDELVEECLDHMRSGLSAGESASEVELAHNLNGSQTDNIMWRAQTRFYDDRADIDRDYRDGV